MAPSSGNTGHWRFGLASEKHPVGVDHAGKVIEDFVIEHSALGWKKLGQKLQSHDRSFCHWDQPEIRRYPNCDQFPRENNSPQASVI